MVMGLILDGGGIPMKTNDLNILLGVLGSPKDGFRIGFVDGCWTLGIGGGDWYEDVCQHDKWDEFMKLVCEYSDYIEGEENE